MHVRVCVCAHAHVWEGSFSGFAEGGRYLRPSCLYFSDLIGLLLLLTPSGLLHPLPLCPLASFSSSHTLLVLKLAVLPPIAGTFSWVHIPTAWNVPLWTLSLVHSPAHSGPGKANSLQGGRPGTTGKTALLPPDTLPLPASFFFASLTTIQNRPTNLSAYCLPSPLEYKLQPDDAPCPGQHGHSVNAHFPSISHWALFKTAHAQVFRGYRRLDPWGTWKPSPHATPPKPHPPCVGSNLWPISLSLPLLRS